MAASPSRLFVWFIGLILVLAAVYVLWAMTDLRDLVPEGVVVAVILLILGIAVMGIASQFNGERHATTYDDAPPPPRRGPGVEERRVTEERYGDERRY